MFQRKEQYRLISKRLLFLGLGLVFLTALVRIGGNALAGASAAPIEQASPIHPTFPLLDQDGENVLETGKPVSTMNTCGSCHDTEFISSHSAHSNAGLEDFSEPGIAQGSRPWDTSSGIFGKWNPFFYRYLSVDGDPYTDLTTPDWLKQYGFLHAGGGPAATSRDGLPLTEMPADASSPETSSADPVTGELTAWDWNESGVVEMNCFLCHTAAPNNIARAEALESGRFGWANTATLAGSGIVEASGETYVYEVGAFDENGDLKEDAIAIQDPTSSNCGQCHEEVHTSLEEPLVTTGCSLDEWQGSTTGQVVSPQRLSDSGMNLEEKETLTRSWDVHAERALECTDCHYSLNNPVYFQESAETQPEHLIFDPRRLELGEYLFRPVHQFAQGEEADNPALANTMRRCEACHSIEDTHDWLPYKESHIEALSCETCHIPKVYSSAFQQVDWTVVTLDGEGKVDCRGTSGDPSNLNTLMQGYQPALLPRQGADGEKLTPYNLVTTWYWVYGNPERPVPQKKLVETWLEDGAYAPEVVAVLDQDGDGTLQGSELTLETGAEAAVIANRLESLGLSNPRITGEILSYSINHGVAEGDWVTADCKTCHTSNSRITQPVLLSSYVPGGVIPEFTAGTDIPDGGKIEQTADGTLVYRMENEEDGVYILGHDRVGWVDLAGSLAFVGVLLGVGTHASFRFVSSLRKPKHAQVVKKVYMYAVYERFWHWLQTFTILGLLFTGLIIHKPDTFGILSFRYVVLVHNVLAVILMANAVLSLFYHLASGEIKQYIPRPAGFFDQAITQAVFYVKGIFKGEPHPFEKTPEKKLNPLQQVTYFVILNILLPLQGLTGILMWGTQQWPDAAARFGGLPGLAPFHSLVAWFFAAFIVMHVYLTTTGHTPLASIQAMMMGWDEVETHNPAKEEAVS